MSYLLKELFGFLSTNKDTGHYYLLLDFCLGLGDLQVFPEVEICIYNISVVGGAWDVVPA